MSLFLINSIAKFYPHRRRYKKFSKLLKNSNWFYAKIQKMFLRSLSKDRWHHEKVDLTAIRGRVFLKVGCPCLLTWEQFFSSWSVPASHVFSVFACKLPSFSFKILEGLTFKMPTEIHAIQNRSTSFCNHFLRNCIEFLSNDCFWLVYRF
jgi:hypothetical protein